MSTPAGRVVMQWNKCPRTFSLSLSFDKLKLVGHQTASHLAGMLALTP